MAFPMPSQGNDGGLGGDSGGAPQNDGSQNGNQGGINPAWNDVLNVIPQELHSQVTPHLQKWDGNFQRVQQQYAPYKQFLDNKVEAPYLQQAYQLAKALETDPEGVYNLLHQEFGQQQQNPQGQPGVPPVPQGSPNGQGQPGNAGGVPDEMWENVHPALRQQFEQMKKATDTMAEILLGQRQQQQEKQEDEELEAIYQGLATRNPTFAALNKDGKAEPYINSLLDAGYSPEDAEKQLMEFIESVGQHNNRPKPPIVLGAGGGMVPDRNFDPRKLDGPGTRDLVNKQLQAMLNPNNR